MTTALVATLEATFNDKELLKSYLAGGGGNRIIDLDRRNNQKHHG